MLPTLLNGRMPTLLSGRMPTLLSGPLPTLLGGRMPTLLSGPLPTLLQGVGLGDAASVLNDFLAMTKANPSATFFVSKSSGTGAGTVEDIPFVVISQADLVSLNLALAAGGADTLSTSALSGKAAFIPDAAATIAGSLAIRLAIEEALRGLAKAASTGVAPSAPTGGLSTGVKVLLGLGAVAAVAGGVYAYRHHPSSPGFAGAAHRRRRRRR